MIVDLHIFVSDGPIDPDDTLLSHYLISTWAKVCQAMGAEFEPYLPVVMPPLLAAAGAKPDLSIYGEFKTRYTHYVDSGIDGLAR